MIAKLRAKLAAHRKGIIATLAGAITGFAASKGHDLSPTLVGGALTGLFTWLIPNAPSTPPAPPAG